MNIMLKIFIPVKGDESHCKLKEESSLVRPYNPSTEEDESIGGYVDDELHTLLTFQRPDSLPLYHRKEEERIEICDNGSGGLETIFGNDVNNNAWELGSRMWSNMPGALQVKNPKKLLNPQLFFLLHNFLPVNISIYTYIYLFWGYLHRKDHLNQCFFTIVLGSRP